MYALDSHYAFDQEGVVTCAAHGFEFARRAFYRAERGDYDFRDGGGAVSAEDWVSYLVEQFYR